MIAKDTIINSKPDILLIKGNYYEHYECLHTITIYDHFGNQITMMKDDVKMLFKKRKKNWYNKLLDKTLWKI